MTHADTPPIQALYRIQFRRGGKFNLKPGAEAIDGQVAIFRRAWEIGPEDSSIYIGEWAMQPSLDDWKTWPENAPAWIASGDLERIADTEGGHL